MKNFLKKSSFLSRFFLMIFIVSAVFTLDKTYIIHAKELPKEDIHSNPQGEVSPEISQYITGFSQEILQNFNLIEEDGIEDMIAEAKREKNPLWSGALESWKDSYKRAGYLTEIKSIDILSSERGYIAHIKSEGEKRAVDIRVEFDGVNMEIISISFNPVYTLAENMQKAALNTALGMGIVFFILIFISLLIGGFKYINIIENKIYSRKEDKAERLEEKRTVSTKGDKEETLEGNALSPMYEEKDTIINPEEDLELIAVITAAIASYRGESTEGLIVRSVRRKARR